MSDKLEWMYKNSNSVDPEEYLLGRAVDKNFEKQVFNDIDKDILPTSIFANSTSNVQVDVIRKIKEDPLEQIKQKEIELRKQLLKNPVKLKKLRNMLSSKGERKMREKDHKKKKKMNEELDSILTEKYSKLVKRYGAQNLVELTKIDSDSSEEDEPIRSQTRNKQRKRKNDSSDSSDYDSSNSSRLKTKQGHYMGPSNYRKQRSKNENSKKTSGDVVRNEPRQDDSPLKTLGRSKDRKYRRRTPSGSSSSSDEPSAVPSDSDYRSKGKFRHDYQSDEEISSTKKSYGLVLSKGGRRDIDYKNRPIASTTDTKRKIESGQRGDKFKRPVQTKLSEEEKAKRLKEMMTNGEWRDKDRKNRVTKYREDQRKEDSKEQKYDGEFLRKQMAKASSKSVEERIKSKMNHLQRSKSSMDQSFTRRK